MIVLLPSAEQEEINGKQITNLDEEWQQYTWKSLRPTQMILHISFFFFFSPHNFTKLGGIFSALLWSLCNLWQFWCTYEVLSAQELMKRDLSEFSLHYLMKAASPRESVSNISMKVPLSLACIYVHHRRLSLSSQSAPQMDPLWKKILPKSNYKLRHLVFFKEKQTRNNTGFNLYLKKSTSIEVW